jgi:hypothetical protein
MHDAEVDFDTGPLIAPAGDVSQLEGHWCRKAQDQADATEADLGDQPLETGSPLH